MLFLIQIQFSGITFLWVLFCIVLGVGYAWIMYGTRRNLDLNLRRLLFVLRAITVGLIAFLFFAPLIKTINKTIEKPILILAQDNSASINIAKPASFNRNAYARDIRALQQKLAKDYEVHTLSFGSRNTEGLNFGFDQKVSDISSVFKLMNERFANRNVGAVILASDGIYNRGGNPLYNSKALRAPVYTVALGDTVPKRDLLIANVNYNDIVYLDNQFRTEISIEAFECRGAQSVLTVTDKSGVVFTKNIFINSNEFRQTIPVNLLARQKGLQRYTFRLKPIGRELSISNNTQSIFPEVIEGKQNVLIIANAPHPDIAALKQSIAINKNYQVSTSLATEVGPAEISKAQLVVLHQLPSQNNPAQKLLQQIAGKPVLYILGAQSNTAFFSSAQNLLNINSSGTTQEALPVIEPDFYGFTLAETTREKLSKFAPLLVPFGNYALKNQASVLLGQQIGKAAAGKPMLVFGDAGQHKIGILTGEGLWRWRLEDFAENSSHEAIDELFSKTVQYLSSRDDKRKFRVYPAKNAFDENEHVVLNAELYNDAYELVNSPDVSLSVRNVNGKSYSFLFSRTGSSYILDAGVLPSGEYTFNAGTRLGKKAYQARGQFVVSEQQAELRQTLANHQLLYSMANQSGGGMVYPQQIPQLPALIKNNENVKTISYENKTYEELINIKTLFFVILTLLSAEWFIRKRNGEI